MSSDAATLQGVYSWGPVVIITAVTYDYFLTFAKEIDYVWLKPWTRVPTIFVIVRYIGICWVTILALIGSAFVPGPIDVGGGVILTTSSCTAMYVVGDWGYILFLAAADYVMILRVYAMWNRSGMILSILLFIYVSQLAISVVWEGIYEGTLSVTTVQVLNSKYCNYSTILAPSVTYRAIPRFILGVALLVLAVIPTLQELVVTYKVTKRWKTNHSMTLLMREGAVYFVVNLLFNIVNLIQLQDFNLMLFLDAIGYVLSCTIMPRFIISVRELYHRDLRDRWLGIDTGFGVFSELMESGNATRSVIAFADATEERAPQHETVGDHAAYHV